jgi:hypothetical protein
MLVVLPYPETATPLTKARFKNKALNLYWQRVQVAETA